MNMLPVRAFSFFILSIIILAGSPPSFAQGPEGEKLALTSLGIEELMNIRVTSVSKKEEYINEAAASIYVITHEDIRRSGATSIPEVLRMAPGLEVANINANQYAITARGQNHMFSEKLLVMIDGRAVYSPTFSGVWWVAQNYPLEEIDRIEVILGPGAVQWGSNAVNGVINIVSKNAKLSQGLMVSAGGGNEYKGLATVRYGGGGPDFFYRAYLMGGQRDGGRIVKGEWSDNPRDGGDSQDDMRFNQGGFRMDWNLAENRHMTFQGDLDRVEAGAVGSIFVAPKLPTAHYENKDIYNNGNLLWLFTQRFDEFTKFTAQLYYDRAAIDKLFFKENRDTYDSEFQYDFRPGKAHYMSVGANYRYSRHDFTDTAAMSMPDDDYNLYGVFAQDEIRLVDDKLKFVLGAKLEHNKYTGWEVQPNVRAAWIEKKWTLWGSVARAVRLPNRMDNGLNFNFRSEGTSEKATALVGRLIGDGRVVSEELLTYEVGMHLRPASNVSVDLSAYYNTYKNLVDTFPVEGDTFSENTPQPYHLVLPIYEDNVFEGDTYGGEVVGNWKPASWVRLSGGYVYTKVHLCPMAGKETGDTTDLGQWISESSPLNTFKGRVFIDLPGRLEFDTLVYYVDPLMGVGAKKYLRLDLRLGWRPVDSLELSLAGRNLLQDRHYEFESQMLEENAWIERDFVFKVTYRY